MNVKQSYMILAGVTTLSAGIGVVAGFFFSKKKLGIMYNDISKQEIADAKEFYSVLHKKGEYETPESTVENLGLTEAVDALRLYRGDEDDMITGDVRIGSIDPSITGTDESDPTYDFDLEDELGNRSPDKPYIISHDEFMDNEPDYNQLTLAYFDGDDVLSDIHDQPIDDVIELVGLNYQWFGHGSKDSRIVYIRNEKLSTDFEIVHNKGKYVEEVLGFIQHDDNRRLIRRFRGDDE